MIEALDPVSAYLDSCPDRLSETTALCIGIDIPCDGGVSGSVPLRATHPLPACRPELLV